MGACESGSSTQTAGTMQKAPPANMKLDGKSKDWVCPAPYEQVCKHVQFNTMLSTLLEAGKMKSFTATGSGVGATREIVFMPPGLQETCIYAAENGHGYTISRGFDGMSMHEYRANITAHRIPGENMKCLVSFTASYHTSNKGKTDGIMSGILMMWELMYTKLIPEKIMKSMPAGSMPAAAASMPAATMPA